MVLIFEPDHPFPDQLFAGFSTLGVTVSPDKDLGPLVRAFGRPVVGTSANISGQGDVFVDLGKAIEDIGDSVDLILDGGATLAGAFADRKDRVNTILDFTMGRPRLVRAGFVPTEAVLKVFPDLDTDIEGYKAQLAKSYG